MLRLVLRVLASQDILGIISIGNLFAKPSESSALFGVAAQLSAHPQL